MEHPTPPLHQAEPDLSRLGENRPRSRPAPVGPKSSPLERKILETLRAEPVTPQPEETPVPAVTQAEPIPARMLNEFVYCQRLFYYEHVEGIFVESADTLRGSAIHKKVDSGSGALPDAKAEGKADTRPH